MVKSLIKRSSYLIISQAFGKVISFFYVIFLARTLGVENFGLYTTALAYYTLFSAVSDFGLNRYLIREGSKNQQKIPGFLIQIAVIRFFMTSLFFLVFSAWVFRFDTNHLRAFLSSVAVLALIPQGLALTLDATLIARQKILFSALGWFVLALSNALFGIYLIQISFSTLGAVIALSLSHTIYLILLIVFNGFNYKIVGVSLSAVKSIMFGSLPYGILAMLGLIYFRVDTILLSYIRGIEETGIYGVAYKFIESIIFLPNAVFTVLFPAMARLHLNDVSELKRLYFSSVLVLGIVSIAVFLLFIFVLPLVILLLLPGYVASVQALRILSLAIPFMFIQVPTIAVLFSTSKYLKEVIFFSLITLLFNLVLNLIFIPSFGFIAAAWITVASEVLSFVIFYLLLQRKVFKANDNL